MITPSWYPNRSQLRQFAMISLPGFGLVGAVVMRWSETLAWGNVLASVNPANVLWAVGALVFLVGLASPEAIRPLYLLMMALTLPIGWVVSALLLRGIFYLVFTPLGLVFRLIGRDPLRLKKPAGDSFWLDHPDRVDAASYYQQS
jgi:hypothetical protein